MTTEIQPRSSTAIVAATAQQYGYSDAQLEIIRQVAAAGCDDYEIAQLLVVAHQTGLNPLLRQIYMIKRWNAAQKRQVAMPQTSIDGYRAIADRTGKYAPGREPAFTYDKEGQLLSATAFVKKLAGGAWHEVAATAFWSEYAQVTKDGKLFETWAKMPHVMLSKCAESLALRRAFPGELSGVYTADEMAQADNPPAVLVETVAEPEPAAPTFPARWRNFEAFYTEAHQTFGWNKRQVQGRLKQYGYERLHAELLEEQWEKLAQEYEIEQVPDDAIA
jgi:phage recombination protein Bet